MNLKRLHPSQLHHHLRIHLQPCCCLLLWLQFGHSWTTRFHYSIAAGWQEMKIGGGKGWYLTPEDDSSSVALEFVQVTTVNVPRHNRLIRHRQNRLSFFCNVPFHL